MSGMQHIWSADEMPWLKASTGNLRVENESAYGTVRSHKTAITLNYSRLLHVVSPVTSVTPHEFCAALAISYICPLG